MPPRPASCRKPSLLSAGKDQLHCTQSCRDCTTRGPRLPRRPTSAPPTQRSHARDFGHQDEPVGMGAGRDSRRGDPTGFLPQSESRVGYSSTVYQAPLKGRSCRPAELPPRSLNRARANTRKNGLRAVEQAMCSRHTRPHAPAEPPLGAVNMLSIRHGPCVLRRRAGMASKP